jgi:hypothetical protein
VIGAIPRSDGGGQGAGRVARILLPTLIGLAALWFAGSASAQSSQVFGPWDGTNPFNCVLQQAGEGPTGPNPEADPYCVEFDKTDQNLSPPDFGMVEFLANEPARVAAAAPKCFYFQRDHWTGSVLESQPPELWHWDGNYFFDKARGIGGVNVDDFRVGGVPFDATPFAPPQYQPFFNQGGGGGVIVLLESEPDPSCVEKAQQEDVYANRPVFKNCIPPGGELRGRQVGKVELGMSPESVRELLGPPHSERNGVERWCVIGDGELRIAYRHGSSNGAALILTTVLGHEIRGVRAGTKRRKATRRLDLERQFRVGKIRVFEGRRRPARRLFVGIEGKRVQWLAVTDPGRLQSRRATKQALKQAS